MYKFVTLVFFLVFLIGGFAALHNDITVENLQYLLKYIGTEPDEAGDGQSTVTLSASGIVCTGIYRDDFAVVDGESFVLYGFDNSLRYTVDHNMAQPRLLISARYMVCYDIGGNTLIVFNSFSEVRRDTYDYPIVCADINDSGYICVATSEEGVQSAVYVYSPSGGLVYKWKSADKFVTSVSVSSDQTPSALICCVKASGGSYASELITVNIKQDSPSDVFSVGEKLPVVSSVRSDGTYCVLTDTSLVCYNRNTGTVYEYKYNPSALRMYRSSDRFSAVAVSTNIIGSESTVLLLDEKCEELYRLQVSTQLMDMKISDKKAYILTYGCLYSVDLDTFACEKYDVLTEYKEIHSAPGGRVILRSESKATSVYLV